MKSKLLEESQVNQLLAVKSIEEVVELLEESAYQQDLVELSSKYSGVELVTRAVDQNVTNTLKKIAQFLPLDGSTTFDVVVEEWTMQNLKAIIASKATGSPLNGNGLITINDEQRHLATLSQDDSLDLKKIIRKLGNLGYDFSKVFKKIEHEYNAGEIQDFRQIYKKIDDYYYTKLAHAAEHRKDPTVKSLLLARINFINVMAVARLKLANVADKEITANIIAGSPKLKRDAVKLIQKENIDEVVSEIVKTHKLSQEIAEEFKVTRSLVKLEVALQRKIVQQALKVSKVSTLSFAVILAYIYLKQGEASFIKAIAYSTQAGIREEMKNLVFAVR